METERWKPIEEFNGEYEVSNLGRVRSMKRYGGMVGRIMPQTRQPSGRDGKLTYFAVMFHMNNKSYCRKVHRLVAEAFVPNPDNLPQINHKDGCKTNNVASNLEWCTAKANTIHAIRNGLMKPGANAHRWTDEEREQIRQRQIAYYERTGRRNTKPKRTWAEYQAERRAKAEEHKRLKALQPKPPHKRGWKWIEESRRRVSERLRAKVGSSTS